MGADNFGPAKNRGAHKETVTIGSQRIQETHERIAQQPHQAFASCQSRNGIIRYGLDSGSLKLDRCFFLAADQKAVILTIPTAPKNNDPGLHRISACIEPSASESDESWRLVFSGSGFGRFLFF